LTGSLLKAVYKYVELKIDVIVPHAFSRDDEKYEKYINFFEISIHTDKYVIVFAHKRWGKSREIRNETQDKYVPVASTICGIKQ
jgi:hypothetical protein